MRCYMGSKRADFQKRHAMWGQWGLPVKIRYVIWGQKWLLIHDNLYGVKKFCLLQ